MGFGADGVWSRWSLEWMELMESRTELVRSRRSLERMESGSDGVWGGWNLERM